jgi:hypothetical protein
LCIDADEVVTPELRNSITAVFRTDPAVDAFEINRHAFYAGKRIDHCGWYPQWRMFLYRRGAAHWGGEEPHTVVVFHGRQKGRLDGDLNHYTYAGIEQQMAKGFAAARDGAIAMHRSGKCATLFDLLGRGPWAFIRTYFLQLGFLDGFYGLVIATITCFHTFLKYAMLREMNRRKREGDETS